MQGFMSFKSFGCVENGVAFKATMISHMTSAEGMDHPILPRGEGLSAVAAVIATLHGIYPGQPDTQLGCRM
jgi:hypothetical protein